MMLELFEMRRFLPLPYEAAMEPRLRRAQDKLQGGDPRLGWVRLPGEGTALLRLHTLAESIRVQGRTLLVVEDGGLCDGVQGAAECLGAETGRVCFLGGLPPEETLRRALDLVAYQSVVLYTAGSEHTPAFQLLRNALTERYGAEAGRFILVAGDLASSGGGGFGLLTAAGLLPLAVCGVDIGELLGGATRMRERCRAASFENDAWRYAAVRRQLRRSGFSVELLACWDSALKPLLEWVKRLFAAAEGKERKALLPVVVDYSREFRSLGQYIQDGPRLLFETVVRLDEGEASELTPLREAAMEGTLLAHTERGVPNLILRPGGKTAETLGGLIYFFEYACGLCACLLEADPLDCPGVRDCEERIRGLFLDSGMTRGTLARQFVGAGIP